jgi:hypothetical protein
MIHPKSQEDSSRAADRAAPPPSLSVYGHEPAYLRGTYLRKSSGFPMCSRRTGLSAALPQSATHMSTSRNFRDVGGACTADDALDSTIPVPWNS